MSSKTKRFVKDQTEKILNEKIRPMLEMHGGGVEVVEINEEQGNVKVKFSGMCVGCPASGETFNALIENELLQVSGVKSVEMIE